MKVNIPFLITRVFVPVLILGTALAVGAWLIANPEEAKKGEKPLQQAALVKVSKPETGDYTIPVEALGQVIPSMKISLKAQVSGEILAVNKEFIPGGHLQKSDEIVKIDPANYKIAVAKQEALLKQAEAAYKLEQGRQGIAKDELAILARTTGRKLENTSLALRTPQREQAKAEIDKAKSDLETAKLDLERTTVTAPFNALITERDATLGDKISAQDKLATLVSTDEYWIELSLPVNELQWLDLPAADAEKGSKAYIFMDSGRGTRTGYLKKITGSLDNNSRFAGLLVSVSDPLLLTNKTDKASPLLLGDYVKVIIDGQTLNKAVRIPLPWLRDGNIVWVLENEKLVFKKVTPVYEDREFVYITEGLSAADRIITSDIPVPVEGMTVRTIQEARANVTDKMIKQPKEIKPVPLQNKEEGK